MRREWTVGDTLQSQLVCWCACALLRAIVIHLLLPSLRHRHSLVFLLSVRSRCQKSLHKITDLCTKHHHDHAISLCTTLNVKMAYDVELTLTQVISAAERTLLKASTRCRATLASIRPVVCSSVPGLWLAIDITCSWAIIIGILSQGCARASAHLKDFFKVL